LPKRLKQAIIDLRGNLDKLVEKMCTEAEFLDEILTKVLRVFSLLFTVISSNSHNLLQFLEFSYCTLSRRKKENLIETIPPSLWFKKLMQKPQV
jgi:hypothetical protein